jgi:hypothetical protein
MGRARAVYQDSQIRSDERSIASPSEVGRRVHRIHWNQPCHQRPRAGRAAYPNTPSSRQMAPLRIGRPTRLGLGDVRGVDHAAPRPVSFPLVLIPRDSKDN